MLSNAGRYRIECNARGEPMTRGLQDDDLQPIASNGILHRRLFLKNTLCLATAAAATNALAADTATPPAAPAVPVDPANPPWIHKSGLPFTGYGKPSKHEARTLRNIGRR